MKKFSYQLGALGISILSLLVPGTVHANGQFVQISSDVTVLVNKQHALAASYTPTDLETPTVLTANIPSDDEAKLRAAAAEHLSAMFSAADQQLGTALVLSSGYRSYANQHELYNASLEAMGVAAEEVVAPAGMSEHQTGLAADIMLESRFCAAQACFAMTRVASWLQNHSYEYGFILRYPLYEQSSTGYDYEPWHYRYVGLVLARQLHETRQTLEQFYDGQISSLTP